MRSGEEVATETSVKQFIWLRRVEKGNETVTGYTNCSCITHITVSSLYQNKEQKSVRA